MEPGPRGIRKPECAFLVRGNPTNVLVTTDNGNSPSNCPLRVSDLSGMSTRPSSPVTHQHPPWVSPVMAPIAQRKEQDLVCSWSGLTVTDTPSMHPFIYLFSECLLSTSYIPGTVVSAGDAADYNTDKLL